MARVHVDIIGDARSALSALRSVRREGERMGTGLRRSTRDLDRFGRGSIAASGALSHLGRSVAFASSWFLGGAGLVYAFKSATHAAKEHEVVETRLAQAVRNGGQSWIAHRKQIRATLEEQARLSAFTDEDLASSLANLVVKTKNVDKALKLNALSANVARGRNMSLEASSRLVLKASIGNSGALRRLGLDISKNATATQILSALQDKFAHQAERFGRTSEGAQERWNKTLDDSKEIIGAGILPAFDKLLRQGTRWLDVQNRSGATQRTVNAAGKDAVAVLGGIAEGLKLVKAGSDPVVDALGGISNTVKALGALWVAMKVKAIIGFGSTAAASSVTRTKVIADAAAMEAALDAATRPRVIPIMISQYGTGKLPGKPTGRAPAPSGSSGGLRGIAKGIAGFVLGTSAAGIAARGALLTRGAGVTVAAILLSAGAGERMGDRSKRYPRTYAAILGVAKGTTTPRDLAILQSILGSYSLENAPDALMAKAEAALKRDSRGSGGHPPGVPGGRMAGPSTTKGAGRTAAPGRTLTTVGRELARAQAFGDTAGEQRLLHEERTMMTRQIASLERRGKLNKKEQAHLDTLYGQLESVNAQLAAIASDDASQAKKDGKKTTAAHKAAAKAAKDAADKIQTQWQNSKQQAAQSQGPAFGGPILGGPLGDYLREYGQMGATVDPSVILDDIKQQNAQTGRIFANLERISKRGGGTGMMNELRALGPEGAAIIASIAGAPKDVFNAIVGAFKMRERQLTKDALFIQAKNVTIKATGSVARDHLDTRKAAGGTVPGVGHGDTVPAMLTPGELVLNRRQQGGLARAMGMDGASPDGLFGAISRMAAGGVAGGGGGGFGGSRLDGRPWWERVGPRRWSPHGARGTPIAPLRRNIAPWLEQFYGQGISRAAGRGAAGWWGGHFGDIAKGYGLGGIVDWSKKDWDRTGGYFKRLGGYLNHQSDEFLTNTIPTRSGIKAMAMYFRDFGLAYNPLTPTTATKGNRARTNQATSLMIGQMIHAFNDPINNAGFLAAMLMPIPGPGKLTGPTRALSRLKADLARTGSKFPVTADHPFALQSSNLRLPREAAAGGKAFDREAAHAKALEIFAMAKNQKKGSKPILPAGVKTPGDLVELMHDLFNSAKAGKKERFWYRKSGRAILDYAHGDLGTAHKLAKLAALYSPQVSVEESLRVAARAWEQYKREGTIGAMGIPGDRNAFGESMKQRNDAMRIMRGEDFHLGGRKVQNFYHDLMRGIDPKWIRAEMKAGNITGRSATMDVWMAKAFGFEPKFLKNKGKYKTQAPTDAQYDFMENVLKSVGDELGWSPDQVQAAVWSTTKARFEGRPIGNAGAHFGDYFGRQSTQINYEANWGALGRKIQGRFGKTGEQQYLEQKLGLIRGGKGESTVLAKLGLLGRGGYQQGVWGLDLSAGAHELMLAPRYAEKLRNFKMLPNFEQRSREAAAIIGYILHQDAVGTMAQFPTHTAAGTLNSNVAAGANALWLARRLEEGELKNLSQQLGTKVFMSQRGNGWIIQSAGRKMSSAKLLEHARKAGVRYKLENATASSDLVFSSDYAKLMAQAEKHSPGITSWAREQRKAGNVIDQQWRERLARGHAGGGIIGGSGRGDSVPAMLTPGELVLNQRQQHGLSRALGMGRSSPNELFGAISRFARGGAVSASTRYAPSMLPAHAAAGAGATTEIHNTIEVPAHFRDTKWAVERGLESATWRLRKGI